MGATAKVLNFEGVSEGSDFRPRRKAEGDCFAVITKVEDHTSGKGNDTWLFTIKIDGDTRAAYPYYVGTDEKQLWKVRALFTAAGIKVPSKRVKADPNKLINKKIAVALIDDEYEGRVKSSIDAVFPRADVEDAMNQASNSSAKSESRAAEDDDDVEDEDEEDTKPVRNKSKAKAKPEPEDDDEDEDEDEPPAKPAKAKSRKAPVVEDDDEDDEDEDEEPPAKPKKKAKSKGKAKKDDDDDDELDLDEL